MVCGPGQGWGNQNQTGRQGGVKRASEKRWGGAGFIGVRNLRVKEWKAKFSTAEWTGVGGGGQNLHYGHDWGLKFPEHSQSGLGVGGRQARVGAPGV